MIEDEFYSATLRCDNCGRLYGVPLNGDQAEKYVDFLDRRDLDGAMGFLRTHCPYPEGWVTQRSIVQRDAVELDRITGVLTTSSKQIEDYIDFCPDCHD